MMSDDEQKSRQVIDPAAVRANMEEALALTTAPTTQWVQLADLDKGAIFETRDGVRAVKSEYYYSNKPSAQCECILLTSGEYAHFKAGNAEPVREIAVTPLALRTAILALTAHLDALLREHEAHAAVLGEDVAAIHRPTTISPPAPEGGAEESSR